MIMLLNASTVIESNLFLLRPSSLDDKDALSDIAEPIVWQYTSTHIETREDLEAYLQAADEERAAGTRFQFTIIMKEEDLLIGNTSFGNISADGKSVEIGWTWLARPFWSVGLNRVFKFMLLRYAFETAGFERVEFRVMGNNIRAQKALAKIGAQKEKVLPDAIFDRGKYQDEVHYVILREHWPALTQGVFKGCELYDHP